MARGSFSGCAAWSAANGPYEVQIIELPDEAALDAFMADPRRVASAPIRDRSVARTEIARVTQVRRPRCERATRQTLGADAVVALEGSAEGLLRLVADSVRDRR